MSTQNILLFHFTIDISHTNTQKEEKNYSSWFFKILMIFLYFIFLQNTVFTLRTHLPITFFLLHHNHDIIITQHNKRTLNSLACLLALFFLFFSLIFTHLLFFYHILSIKIFFWEMKETIHQMSMYIETQKKQKQNKRNRIIYVFAVKLTTNITMKKKLCFEIDFFCFEIEHTYCIIIFL